ncbi:restriction endonuclease subunit S, partial [uncultured Alistipes sp.]|uniref:restriction endonuclease subunit S n=2 Tax=uncultured Alistipes sp. TaxID=538949 RepID=UPI00272FA896
SHYQNLPFEIPENWCWTTIGEIFMHNTGKALNASNQEGVMLDYITTSNLYWNHFDLTVVKKMRFTEAELEKCTVTNGDLLICEGGDVGRAAIWNYNYDIRIQNHIHRLKSYLPLSHAFYYYIFYFYKSLNLIGGKGVAIQGLSSGDIHKLVAPLPPIAEQQRIVREIERWFAIIDKLETSAEDLKVSIQQTKSRILDLALSGKLVSQDPDDEPAIELLKRVNPNFKPCDSSHYPNLPKGWSLARIKDVFTINPRNKANDEATAGFISMNMIDDEYSNTFTFEKRKWQDIKTGFTHFQNGDIAVAKISPCLENRKSIIIQGLPNRIGAGTTELHVFRSTIVNPKYALYFFKTDYFIDSCVKTFNGVVGQQRVGKNVVEEIVIPTPPIKEQQRIVTMLETIFSQLNTITAEL